jgi:branched-chain amino acid transport system permease protein
VLAGDFASGIPYGCVYALVALGLVITYRASGVFNFAFGAQAFVSAAVFYTTRTEDHWPLWAAAAFSVVGVGAVLGLLLDRLLFRHLRRATTTARLVVSLGLLVGLPAAVQAAWFGAATRLGPPPLGPSPARQVVLGPFRLDTNELAVVAATAAVLVLLGALLRSRSVGVRLRALVESPRLLELAGVRTAPVSAAAWAVSSVLAGLAGVLLAPLYASLDALQFDVLVVAAIAAAALGRLRSLSLAVAGGLLLGVGQEVLTSYLPLGSQLAEGLRPSLPFVLLLGLLLASSGLRAGGETEDPLASVDPPVLEGGFAGASPWPPGPWRWGLVVAAAAALVVGLPAYWLYLASTAVAMAVVFLSYTVLTGMGGLLSLCQAELAGVGAFTAGQLAQREGLPVLVGVVVGGLVAAAVGVVAALPSLRLGGLYLALATFAFGLLLDNLVFPESWAGNGSTGLTVPRPLLGPVDFSASRPFFLLSLAVLALAGGAVVRLQRGTTGQRLAALRGSELGAEAVGIDVRRAKMTAFVLAAALAGVGGALLGSALGAVSSSNFTFFQSLFWLVIVAVMGVRTVSGAVGAGFALVFAPKVVALLPGRLSVLAAVVFGFAALAYARHPEGLLSLAARLVRPARPLEAASQPASAPPGAEGLGADSAPGLPA